MQTHEIPFRWRHFLFGALILIFSASSCNGVTSEGGSVSSERLQPTDLSYLGAFRFPPGGAPPNTWGWGGSAMTFYPGGDPSGPADGFPGSLFATGNDQQQYLSEISIPAPVISSNLADLNTATTLQGFANIRGALYDYIASDPDLDWEIPRAGLAYLPRQGSQTTDKLYFTWGVHMQELHYGPSHGWAELNLSDPQAAGLWQIGSGTGFQAYVTTDYLFDIPQAWADAHTAGLYLATGRYRDGGQGAKGPSVIAYGPWNHGNPPAADTSVTATPLLLYGNVYEEPPAAPEMTNYHDSDEWSGAAWLTAGDRGAVIFVGTKGTGNCWYGLPDGTVWEPPYPDDPENQRGWWSTGFAAQIVFYDPADLAAVAAGTMEPHEPQPYATLDIDDVLYNLTSDQQKYQLGAAAFDRGNGFLYVLEWNGDTEHEQPIAHVWRVE